MCPSSKDSQIANSDPGGDQGTKRIALPSSLYPKDRSKYHFGVVKCCYDCANNCSQCTESVKSEQLQVFVDSSRCRTSRDSTAVFRVSQKRTLEDRGEPHLFKLRQTKGVQRLLARQVERTDCSWTKRSGLECGGGYSPTNRVGQKRRVVILRRAIQPELTPSRNNSEGQLELLLPGQDVQL